MAKSLTEPNADQQVIDVYNRSMRAHDVVKLNPDLKYAVVMLKMNKGVGEADYPGLIAAIEALPGVRKCDILIDHLTRVEVPVDYELRAVVEVQVRLDPIVQPGP